MKQWEYKIKELGYDKLQILNALGLEGWELVDAGVAAVNQNSYCCIFKREIVEPETQEKA